jgi:O-antigen/teichoic acid export membrane protein
MRVVNILILARLLLQAEMGQLAILAIIYGFAQFLGALGLNHASPLVVPLAEKEGALGRIRSFLERSVMLIIFSSLLLVAVLIVLTPTIVDTGVLLESHMVLLLIVTPFSALEAYLDSFLLARYKVRMLAAGRLLFDLSRIIFTISLVVAGFGVNGVIAGWIIGEVAAVVIFGSVAASGLPSLKEPIQFLPVLAFALPSLLFQTVHVIIQSIDRIILLNMTNLGTLGVYDVLLGVLFMMSFVSLAISNALYPVLTHQRSIESDSENGDGSVGLLAAHLVRYITMLLLPLALIAAVNSYPLLRLLFGPPYADFPGAALSFSLLVMAYVLWGITYALHTTLRSLGEARFFALIGIVVIVFETIGCWYLTGLLGLLGAAIIRALYILVLFVSSFMRLRSRDIRLPRHMRGSFLRVVIASGVGSLPILLASPEGLVEFIFWGVMGLASYALLLFLLREVNELDFLVAEAILPGDLKRLVRWIRGLYSG